MKLSMLKPLLAAAGTAIMLAAMLTVKPTQATPSTQITIGKHISSSSQINNSLPSDSLDISPDKRKLTEAVFSHRVLTDNRYLPMPERSNVTELSTQ